MCILVPDSGEIASLHTNASFARRGFGSAMGLHIESIARQRNISELTVTASLLAVPLYLSLGFAIEGSVEHPLVDGLTLPSKRLRKVLRLECSCRE
jgi:ribosomal protein S18 acetylase RimI-like enzyme